MNDIEKIKIKLDKISDQISCLVSVKNVDCEETVLASTVIPPIINDVTDIKVRLDVLEKSYTSFVNNITNAIESFDERIRVVEGDK